MASLKYLESIVEANGNVTLFHIGHDGVSVLISAQIFIQTPDSLKELSNLVFFIKLSTCSKHCATSFDFSFLGCHKFSFQICKFWGLKFCLWIFCINFNFFHTVKFDVQVWKFAAKLEWLKVTPSYRLYFCFAISLSLLLLLLFILLLFNPIHVIKHSYY